VRVFEIMVLRKIFRPNTDKVVGEWRGLLKEEHNYVYSSPILFWLSNQENEMCRPCSTYYGEVRCIEF